MELIELQPDALPELLAFLAERFQAPPDADFLQPALAHWKYFAPRPDFPRNRSFILRAEDGKIAAHCCVCPFHLWAGGRPVSSFHISDRAGDPKIPGASLLLGMMLVKDFDTFLGMGGNSASLRITKADRVLTASYGTLNIMTRTLRPFRRNFGQPLLDWKSPLRLGRDIGWNLSHPLTSVNGWSAEPVQCFGQSLPVFDGHHTLTQFLPCHRTPELLNFMLACPDPRFAGYLLRQGSAIRGHFLLSGKNTDARIADLSIQSDRMADWEACYSVAARTASIAYPAATQVSAAAFPDCIQKALLATGFRFGKPVAVRVTDKQKLLTGQPLLPNLNMIDWDEAYLF